MLNNDLPCEIKEEIKPFDRPWEAKSKELHEFSNKLTALCVEFEKFPAHPEQTTFASRLNYLVRDIRQAANTVAKQEAEQERMDKVNWTINKIKTTPVTGKAMVKLVDDAGESDLADMATMREMVRIIDELRRKVDA